MNQAMQTAMMWSSVGVSPIPVIYGSKQPATSWKLWQDRVPPLKVLEHWFKDDRTNIGVICGGKPNLSIIDFDDINSYYDWRKDMIKRDDVWKSVALSSYRVKTPRGMHVYVYTSNKEDSRKDKERSIDIRCTGNYTLVPPSLHPSGNRYEAIGKPDTIITVRSLDEVFPEKIDFDTLVPSNDCNLFVPQDITIQDIKSRVNILSFVGQLTRIYKSSYDGRYWMGRCIDPFHNDKNPSMRVDTKTQRVKCLSSRCRLNHDIGLDVIDLYKIIYGVNTSQAINELKDF